VKMLWKFNKVYNPERQFQEHHRPVHYQMKPPAAHTDRRPDPAALYIHPAQKSVHGQRPSETPAGGR